MTREGERSSGANQDGREENGRRDEKEGGGGEERTGQKRCEADQKRKIEGNEPIHRFNRGILKCGREREG